MTHSFKTSSGKNAFKMISESQEASEYILNKKAKYTYCKNNINKIINKFTYCNIHNVNVKVGSQGNLLLFNKLNRLVCPCYDSIDRTQLYINLYTKLDLSGVPVILDFSGNQVPSTIDGTSVPYLRYDIDPSGNLFGNTTCGINNFKKYMVYDVSNNIIK